MGRSIKKGPYCDHRVLKKGGSNREIWQEVSDQDMVKKINYST
jgi:hypothetical protein